MRHRIPIALTLLLVASLLAALAPLPAAPLPAHAQSGADGWTLYDLNLRAGPGTDFASLGTLPAAAELVFEARDAGTTWLLGHTLDGTRRGWVHGLYLGYRDGFYAGDLPVSSEVIAAPPADDPAPVDPAPAPPDPVTPGDLGGTTQYNLNLRAGPVSTYGVIETLPPGSSLVIEARTADSAWLLVHTADDALRGWVSALYVDVPPDAMLADLPVSDEVIGVRFTEGDNDPVAPENAELVAFLEDVPVLPAISPRARAIYIGSGNNPNRFTTVGDCNTTAPAFLVPFSTGYYDLGPYAYLQSTIDFFGDSFGRSSQAAHVGFNTMMVLDSGWANPQWCEPGESVLWCEYRLSEASVAIIMFGVNDVLHLTPDTYENSLREIVEWSIDHGTIPVLSTFSWADGAPYLNKALQLNVITVEVARAYDVPLINFWLAAQELPNNGMMDDTHLSYGSPPGSALFDGQEATSGFTLRNLLVLQTLDLLRIHALN
ncbi:MAG: SH3 domain-containing protein [Chloroflexi bacterium]|nr:SH3 domain-containing protein [Chloroflexota bacterium]